MKQAIEKNSWICELHFKEDDILKKHVIFLDGKTFEIPIKNFRLKTYEGAIPILQVSIVDCYEIR